MSGFSEKKKIMHIIDKRETGKIIKTVHHLVLYLPSSSF